MEKKGWKEEGRRVKKGGSMGKKRKKERKKERERERERERGGGGGGIKCNRLLVGRTYYLPPVHLQNTTQSH